MSDKSLRCSMLPSSGKVKLNRDVLKGLQLVPRRRRKILNSVTSDTTKRDKVSERVSAKDSECAETVLTEQMAPESVKDKTPDGDSEENRVDIGRKVHPSPAGQADSEGSLRRAVRVSNCVVCGDCKHISTQQKSVSKQGQGSSSPSPDLPMVKYKIKNERTGTKHKKIVLWINRYPKVTLCDIAQRCDACSHNCGFVLPDVINNKVVNCFQKDMRAGFRFEPACFGHNKHKSEESTPAKNNEFCPRVQLEQKTCQSQNVNEHQKHLKEHADARTLSSHPCNFVKRWTSESSATCSSLLLGKRAKKEQCFTDKDVKENPGPSCDLIGVEMRGYKRLKLGNGFKGGILPSTPDSDSICSKNKSKNDSRYKEKTSSAMSSDSQACSELHPPVKDTHKKSCGQIGKIRDTDAHDTHEPSESDIENDDVSNPDDLESFSCQRVRIYSKNIVFSCARTYMCWPFSNCRRTPLVHAGIEGCPAEPIGPLAGGCINSPFNQSHKDSFTDASSKPSGIPFHLVSHQNEEHNGTKEGKSMFPERNVDVSMSSDALKSKNVKAAEALAGLPSDLATCSLPRQQTAAGIDTVSSSPVHVPETNRSTSTLSPSKVGLSDWDTATVSFLSSPFTIGRLSSLSTSPSSLPPLSIQLNRVKCLDLTSSARERPILHSEETQMMSCSSSPSVHSHNSDLFHSGKSSLLLPQDESDEETSTSRSPPKLDPYYKTTPCTHNLPAASRKETSLHNVPTELCVDTNLDMFLLPPLLSPVASTQGHSETSCSDEDDDNKTGHNIPYINSNRENCRYYLASKQGHRSLSNFDDADEEDETDCEKREEQANDYSEQVPSDPKIRVSHTSGVLTESCSSPSSDEDDGGAFSDEGQPYSASEEGSSPYEIEGSKEGAKAEAACDAQSHILDEFSAYKQDILLVDIIQEDPELFDNMPKQSLLKLGPVRVSETPKTRPTGVVKTLQSRITAPSPAIAQRMTPVNIDFHCDSPDTTEESTSRPWRPQCISTPPSTLQSSTWSTKDKQTKTAGQSHVNAGFERIQTIQTVNNHLPPLIRAGTRLTNPANMTDSRRQKTNAYCWQYFSESLSCGFKMCRFQHVPMEGDEKFCVETVTRFAKNPMCLHKAGAVFTGYYQNNPPGVYFSMPVHLSLLWALLKAGMLSEIFSVLSVSLAHKIVPEHEFLLALFNFVREKGLMGYVPELMQLTFKMANAGLAVSLDCLDCVKNTPEFQQTIQPNSPVSVSGNNRLSVSTSEYLNLAHAVVEMELCTKEEDWRRMGEVFSSVCQFNQHPNQVERISGRIAISLLSESKDKLSLPFAAFAEMVCQKDNDEGAISRSFLGRIGVSLMLRYHKTHQWAKGRKVVEVLTHSKISYSTLKGLFGNEDGTSRCRLVTVATELFLLSGCVEGALNILRENDWFLTSCSWPCEPADLESRTHVLMRLAEKSSHRDTLEVLCNLPGLKEPNENVDMSRYTPLFDSHLQTCMDRQMLPVASDTVDFMLSKSLAVDHVMLQTLLHKLGKQNLWLRAREVFRHSLNEGYYPGVSALPGFMALIVPCRLGEVELALTFEMFITANATAILPLSETSTACLSITLKRTKSCESEYLSAGSRVLSAACIPQPKLIIHYTAVNSSQDQVFTLDISSARRWLRHNHLWANEVWTKLLFPPAVPGNTCLPLP